MKSPMHYLSRAADYLSQDIWDVDVGGLAWLPRQLIKGIRIAILTVRGFRQDELPLRASGLTYTTLLSLAPLLAFVFLIYTGLGRGQEMIENIKVGIADMPEQVRDLVLTILAYVENSSTVGLGGFAVVVLLYMVLRMMSNIEYSFNKVWGVTAARPLVRKITDYVSTLVLVPMLIVAAGAITGLRTSEFWINQPENIHLIYGRLLMFGPMFAAWIAFSVLYVFMPNTKVPFFPATIGGFIAAFMWLFWHKFYIWSQGWLLARQDKVFGAFASIPMFMIWLYVCWVVVLFGAELVFSIQRYETFGREHRAGKASGESRILLTLSMLTEMARNLQAGGRAFNTEVFSQQHAVPIRMINDVLRVLGGVGLTAELSDQDQQHVLLRAPDQIPVKEVIDLLVQDGAAPDSLGVENLEEAAVAAWRAANDGMSGSLDGRTILDLIGEESRATT